VIPSERAAQLIAAVQDQYGKYHVPPSEIVKALMADSDLLRKLADERWMVR
jgi:hypothetical protein